MNSGRNKFREANSGERLIWKEIWGDDGGLLMSISRVRASRHVSKVIKRGQRDNSYRGGIPFKGTEGTKVTGKWN